MKGLIQNMILLFSVAFLLSSCGVTEVACVDNGNCAEGQACVAEVCLDVECLSSSECGLQQYCDTVDSYSCLSGCEMDADCMAGETCNEGTCEVYGCRDTQLDCFIGEVCNSATGICEQDPGAHCAECTTNDACGSDGACFTFETKAIVGYCLVECSVDDECPRGYNCSDPTGTGTGQNYCSAWCPLYDEMGYLI